MFLSLHYLPSQLSNRFIPLSLCSRSLCNYFVLVCILFIKPPCRFCLHLFLFHSAAALLTFIPQPSFLFCSLSLSLPWTTRYSSLALFLFFNSLSVSQFSFPYHLSLISCPLSVFLITSSLPTSPILPLYSLSIQLRLGGLHCASQCWLNVPAGRTTALLDPVSLTMSASLTLLACR